MKKNQECSKPLNLRTNGPPLMFLFLSIKTKTTIMRQTQLVFQVGGFTRFVNMLADWVRKVKRSIISKKRINDKTIAEKNIAE